MTKKRWNSFDIIKGAACIAVVLIHYQFTGVLTECGTAVKAMCRFAVPAFFGVSGFFLPSGGEISRKGVQKKIKHVLEIIALSTACYFAFNLLWNRVLVVQEDFAAYAAGLVQPARIVKFFVTNDPFVYAHLWFLLALLYCYLFAYLLMNRPRKARVCMWTGPVFLLGMIFLQEFSDVVPFRKVLSIPGSDQKVMLCNMFLFRALPFFLLGYMARVQEEKLRALRINNAVLLGAMIAGCMIACAEWVLVGKSCQFYLGSYLTVFAMFIWAIKNPEANCPPLRYIGRNLSLYVYVLHIAIGKICDLYMSKKGMTQSMPYALLRPLIVLGVSMLAGWILLKVTQTLAKSREKQRA